MTLRKSLLALSLCLFAFNAFSAIATTEVSQTPLAISAEPNQKVQAMISEMAATDLNNFSIRQVEELTGRKLNFKEKIGFKVAKMKMKKMQRKAAGSDSSKGNSAPGIEKGIYIILAIFIPFVAVGLATDWKGNDWLWCLLWSFLCIGGIIYALMKMKKYYA